MQKTCLYVPEGMATIYFTPTHVRENSLGAYDIIR